MPGRSNDARALPRFPNHVLGGHRSGPRRRVQTTYQGDRVIGTQTFTYDQMLASQQGFYSTAPWLIVHAIRKAGLTTIRSGTQQGGERDRTPIIPAASSNARPVRQPALRLNCPYWTR